MVKSLPAKAGDARDVGSTPESGGSPGGRHDNPSSILAWRIPINRSAWRVMAHEVAESHTAEQLTTTTAQRMGVPAGTSGKEPACQFRRRKRRRFSL